MFYNETMKLQARAARYLGGLGVIFMFSLIYIFQSILNTLNTYSFFLEIIFRDWESEHHFLGDTATMSPVHL